MIKKALLTLFIISVFAGRAFSALTADINHSHIKIDSFYHGSTVSVKGTKDKGTDLIIKISSPEGHESLRRKGKLAGLLWMNVGHLKIENVPSLYSIHSTKALNELLTADEMNANMIGYAALKNSAKIEGAEEKDKWFSEFIKYKEASGLYWATNGKIQITPSPNSESESFQTVVDWPYQAQPGQYEITVYAVKNGVVLEKVTKTILVEQVGIVKALADMAKNNGALYGIISIAIAIGAGFGVGLIFRKGGGGH